MMFRTENFNVWLNNVNLATLRQNQFPTNEAALFDGAPTPI